MYEFIHIVKENVLNWRFLFRCGGVAEWSLAATKERPFRRNSATLPQRKPALSRSGVVRLQLRIMVCPLPPSHRACGF
jgi:hypothetical protein